MKENTDINTKTDDNIHDPEASAEESRAGRGKGNEIRVDRRTGYLMIFLTAAAGIIVFSLLFHAGYHANSYIALALFAVLTYRITDQILSAPYNNYQSKKQDVFRNEIRESYDHDADYRNDHSESIRNINKETGSLISIIEKDKSMKEKRKAAEQKSRDAGWTGYYIPPEVFMSDDPYKIRKGILKSTGHLIPVRYLNNDKNIGKRVGEFLDLMDDEEDL